LIDLKVTIFRKYGKYAGIVRVIALKMTQTLC
jgi:hypothetical protein